MSVVLFESFDLVTLSGLALKGWIVNGGTANSISLAAPGRTGPQCCNFHFSEIIGASGSISRQVAPSQEDASFTLGFGLNPLGGATGIASLRSDEIGTTHAYIAIGAGGQIHVYAGPGLPLIGSSTSILSSGVWYYLELSVLLKSTATGTLTFAINGVTQVSASGIVTKNGGTKTGFDSIFFGGDSNSYTYQVDDVYLNNGAGSINTGLEGDVSVYVLRPANNGAHSGLVNDLGNSTNNYSHVDSTLTQTTTYVQSATPGDEDSYVMSTLPVTAGTVIGVQSVILADKNNSGTRSIVPLFNIGGTEYDGSTVGIGTSPAYYTQIWEKNPATSVIWTISDVNSAQAGVKVE